jgi:hypothetical protein
MILNNELVILRRLDGKPKRTSLVSKGYASWATTFHSIIQLARLNMSFWKAPDVASKSRAASYNNGRRLYCFAVRIEDLTLISSYCRQFEAGIGPLTDFSHIAFLSC